MTVDDVTSTYLGWMRDPEATRFLEARFSEHTIESLRQFVVTMSERDDTVLLAIVALESDTHIGNIKIGPIDRHHGTADIGLLIGERDAWGRGYGTEAIKLATDYAFRELGLRKLTAGCYGANVGSATAFRRAGWVEDGMRLAQFVTDDGELQDEIHFAAFHA